MYFFFGQLRIRWGSFVFAMAKNSRNLRDGGGTHHHRTTYVKQAITSLKFDPSFFGFFRSLFHSETLPQLSDHRQRRNGGKHTRNSNIPTHPSTTDNSYFWVNDCWTVFCAAVAVNRLSITSLDVKMTVINCWLQMHGKVSAPLGNL